MFVNTTIVNLVFAGPAFANTFVNTYYSQIYTHICIRFFCEIHKSISTSIK